MLKELETLTAQLLDIKETLNHFEEELDDIGSYTVNERKKRILRDLKDEINSLDPPLTKAREEIKKEKAQNAFREKRYKSSFQKQKTPLKGKFASHLKKINSFKKDIDLRNHTNQEFIYRKTRVKRQFIQFNRRYTMNSINYLCVLGLSATAFACGGSSSTPPAGGGTPATTNNGGNAGNNGNTGNNGNGGTPEPALTSKTFAQSLSNNNSIFKSKNGVALTVAGFSYDSENTSTLNQPEQVNLKITPVTKENETDATTYTLSLRNNRFTTSSDKDSPSLTSGRVTLKSLDGNWNALLSGTAKPTQRYVRRFEDTQRPESGGLISLRYGVFGVKTDVSSNSIQKTLETAGITTSSSVTYSGQVDGQAFKTLAGPALGGVNTTPTPFSRPVTFSIDFGQGNLIRADFGTPTQGGDVIGTDALTGTGTITGNGFTIQNLNTVGNSSSSSQFKNEGNNPILQGNFYGNAAQDIGGTLTYLRSITASNQHKVGGAFSATRGKSPSE